MRTLLTASRLLTRDGIVQHPTIVLDDGQIAEILTGAENEALPGGLSFPDALLVPAYLDIHIHGAAGQDVMEGTAEALATIGAWIGARGVGGYLPTTVTSSMESTLRALDGIAHAIERPSETGAVPLGIHLEGPFLSHSKRGVHPEKLLERPSIPLFDRFWQAARGHIRLMTIAPELPEALELIEHASKRGVVCSLGHSNATYREAEAGFCAGARSATHTFNAMHSLEHREPGIAGYVLDKDDLFAEILCDGIHVDPAMIRLFFKAKGPERGILITDGISATGMPDGNYQLGDLDVTVEKGRCTLAGSAGTLAGSVLTMDRAVRNFAGFTGSGLPSAAALAARNPAELLGIEEEWGVLEEGRQANITVLSPTGEVVQVFRAGRPVL
ncbi:MAG TPA: N-acetylglucosamine-6-phosphate deacetylase [Acidobacteriaceae bacterium]|jgi:N-acetylglucosamine-6-phosphate deacetylase|nr:N-acetylglucosamine-6-phosphate deacetylase [Acidobacteriaceae bacterium]